MLQLHGASLGLSAHSKAMRKHFTPQEVNAVAAAGFAPAAPRTPAPVSPGTAGAGGAGTTVSGRLEGLPGGGGG